MMKKTLYKYHRLAGLTLGVLLFLMALSGVFITFREELLPVAYPEFRVLPQEEKLPLKVIVEKAQAYIGEKELKQIYNGEDESTAHLILYDNSMAAINPYTGVVIGEMPLFKNIFAVMLFFHANFFLGTIGKWLVGMTGLLLVFFIISGIQIWLPDNGFQKKLKRTFKERLNTQRFHHVSGLILSLPLFVAAITGFLTVFDLTALSRPEEMKKTGLCTIDEQSRALEHMKEENFISVHFCTKKSGLMKMSWNDGEHFSRIIVDPVKGEVIQRFDSEKEPASWDLKRTLFYPLHSGEIFGLPGKIIVFLGGIGLMVLFVSGCLLSLKRRKSKRQLSTRASITKGKVSVVDVHDLLHDH